MRPRNAELVHQRREIVGPEVEVVGLERPVGLAVAALVVADELEVLGQAVPHHAEVLAPEQRAADERERVAVAHIFVENIDPVSFDFWHGLAPP
jgi:hypothetical protein